jgi:demethylmenaquinone methyltransferase/2-methoxy-6-polyprenyl-1,4-benzoquinol methylase
MMKTSVQKIFDEVAPTYELVNRILTLGLDRRWRNQAALAAARGGGMLWLDVCSGTGEMAQNLARLAPPGAKVIALDFCRPMLQKASAKSIPESALVMANVRSLPFGSDRFDLITISFATRNLNLSRDILRSTFQEFHRILKPGGRFINLETSQPKSPVVRRLLHLYVKTIVKPVGYRLSGSRAGYAYLAATIPRFYPAQELAVLLGQAGFRMVTFEHLFLGAAAIHTSIKQWDLQRDSGRSRRRFPKS